MNAGDQLCDSCQREDAVVLLGVSEIVKKRGAPPEPKQRNAIIIRSLKRPAEVRTLRQIYGPWFLLLGALAPRKQYKEQLRGRIKVAEPLMTNGQIDAAAQELIDRDEAGGDASSQNVSGTFHLADGFVDASSQPRLQADIQRFIDLVFGKRTITPTREEYGMFHAHATGLRSASLSRQVGAAIAGPDGEVIAMGMNEVPRAGGGFVWDGEPGDFRDHMAPERRDPSFLSRQSLLAEVLSRLQPWMTDEKASRVKEHADEAVAEAWDSLLRDSQIRSLIEFQRAEHAEAAAIADAARRGVSIVGCTLFTTTYPCHLCAKEIVTAGLNRVVFLEPYPKSRAIEYFPDAITLDPAEFDENHVLFEPFKGVSPRRYLELFTAEKSERVSEAGEIVDFERAREFAQPRLGQPREREPSYLTVFAREQVLAQWILRRVEELYGGQEPVAAN